MGVSADKKTTGEGVVLEDDLVDDTGARAPETNVVLGAGSGQEVVDLLVDVNGAGKILLTTNLGLNEMVAVDSGGVGNRLHASGHELEDSHLGGGILAGHAVGSQLQVRFSTLDLLAMGIVKMRVENLLGVRERSVEASADDGQVLGHLLVVDEVVLLPVVLANLFPRVSRAFATPGRTDGFLTFLSRGESETVARRRMPLAAPAMVLGRRATAPQTCRVASMTGVIN